MEFEFIYDPVPLIIIRNIFTKKENSEILSEAINNKNNFKLSRIGTKKENFRTNTSSSYDIIYNKDRTKSKLLKLIDGIFNNKKINNIFSSFTYPINLLSLTNMHETQVSRYGDQGQQYKYHMDDDSSGRVITLVYYFNKEPKKYKGGEIQFTRSPIHDGVAIDKNQTPITITPENNMMVVFGSKIPHTVLPTTSPKTFDKGRFSVNIWIGIK
tara:strand:+ start:52 stop:690 length:639 start_codon:yes stop_codon:yes gene_type:complete